MKNEFLELGKESREFHDNVYNRLVDKEINLSEMFSEVARWEVYFKKRVDEIVDSAINEGTLLDTTTLEVA